MCSVCSVGNLWTEQPIFFIDFEGSRASGILEFGVVEVLRGEIVSARTRLCRATGGVREEDAAVHGLRAEALLGHAPFGEEWTYFSSLRELGPLAAHYAGVENGLLKSVWPYPRNSPDFARPGERVIDWGPWMDSARIYGQLFPTLDSGRLETLVSLCGLQPQLEVAELLLRAEEFVARDFLFHRPADDGPVFDTENFDIALPTVEGLAIEQRLKALFGIVRQNLPPECRQEARR